LLGEARCFSPVIIGAVGWLTFGYFFVTRARAKVRMRMRAADVALLLASLVFLVVAVGGRDEPWGHGRDQQVYADDAVLLADTGSATLITRAADAADAELLRAIGTDRSVDRYLGVTRSATHPTTGATITAASYLPLGWPVWLAFAYAIGGLGALHAANAPVFLLGALLLYPILAPAVGRTLASAAVIALLALPSSLWIAGIALSEPLAMLASLTTVALFASSRQGRRFVAFVVFAASIVRLDALLLAPAVIIARTADAALRDGSTEINAQRTFALSVLAAVGGVLGWYALLGPRYLRDGIDYVVPVVVMTVIAVAATFAGRPANHVLRSKRARQLAALAAIAAIAFCIYCLWIRPNLAPFAIINRGTPLDGTRDFREDSLRNLAVYVGWPLLLLAIAGIAVAIVRFVKPTVSPGERAFVLCGLVYGVVYAYAPLVSPDHPWAIRRFVPVVIPMAVAFAVLALHALAKRRSHGPVVASIAIVGLASSASAVMGAPMLALNENRGAAALIGAVDEKMPDDLVVATLPAANAAAALAATRHRQIVVTDLDRPANRAAVGRWLASKSALGKPAWLLVGDEILPSGARMNVVARAKYERHFVARAERPPARVVQVENVALSLVRMDGLEASLAFSGFGGTPSWSIIDRGFQRSAPTPFGTLRMTDGSASLDVPSAMLDGATALEFVWFSWAPRGESRAVAVRINDQLVWRANVAPGVSNMTVSLPPRGSSTAWHIDIESDAFDPRVFDPADYRERVGIGVLQIKASRSR
ncbi:MAG TPA: hypothetical protein VJX31_12805, partial [Casimicrobiaceae bacterium]|nr:hypothetical protein [Casimicrobiaceae bacterium]